MNLNLLLGLAAFYLLGLPLLLRLFFGAQRKFVTSLKMKLARGNPQKIKLMAPVESKWPAVKERLRFVVKDGRGAQFGKVTTRFQNRQVFFGLLLLGLAAFLLPALLGGAWWLLALGATLFLLAILFGNQAPKAVLATRRKVIERMYNIASQKLGSRVEEGQAPSSVVQVLEWEEVVRPKKASFVLPDTFAEEGGDAFLRQFNQIFGQMTTWVPSDDPETGKSGWDFEEGQVTIRAVPPLPQRADWDETYVLDPGIAWSFFPIGLGVENGLERLHPVTGAKENILGFDVNGEAPKAAAAAGYKLSTAITPSPHVLCAGGTGGGKSLNVDTLVATYRPLSAQALTAMPLAKA